MEQPKTNTTQESTTIFRSFFNLFSSSDLRLSPKPASFFDLHQNVTLYWVRPDLCEIDLSYKKLTSTDGISYLQAICEYGQAHKITLRLQQNNLTVLSGEIGNLGLLTHLDVSSNQLHELPQELGALTQLRILSCYNNKISDLPTSVENLTNLTSLNIGCNTFNQLPKAILALVALQSLSCGFNNIHELPPAIKKFRNLRYLYAHHNALTQVPQELSELTNLEILDVSQNNVELLPPELLTRSNLRLLNWPCTKTKRTTHNFLQQSSPVPVTVPVVNTILANWMIDLLKGLKFW